jgi:signal transduction histidine kinase
MKLLARLIPGGLSARLLLATVGFVMLGVLLIFAPTIARLQVDHMEARLTDAAIATVAISAARDDDVGNELEQRLLRAAGSYGIMLHRPGVRALVLSRDMPHPTTQLIDLREASVFTILDDAVLTLLGDGRRMLRILGHVPSNPEMLIETVVDGMPLREEMLVFSRRMLIASILIALFTAGLVYLSLQWLLVRPMQRITAAVSAFRAEPENPRTAIVPSGRSDEIGRMERELAHMQENLLAALRQRARLAQLGGAMAKINHDLRNILASAQLVSDTVSASDDPKVKRVAPTLLGAIDRAIALCTQTLTFAAGGTQLPVKHQFAFKTLVSEVFDIQSAGATREIAWNNRVEPDFHLTADRGQIYRVLTNLTRNAIEAGATAITVESSAAGGWSSIDVVDDGPGLTPRALERLFQPFAGSTRPGGTGLGLAIARELMRGHGGEIELAETGATGTRFRLTVPRTAEERAAAAPATMRAARLRLRR